MSHLSLKLKNMRARFAHHTKRWSLSAEETAFIIDSSGPMEPLWQTIRYQTGAINLPNQADVDAGVAFADMWLRVALTGNGWDDFVEQKKKWLQREQALVRSIKQPVLVLGPNEVGLGARLSVQSAARA